MSRQIHRRRHHPQLLLLCLCLLLWGRRPMEVMEGGEGEKEKSSFVNVNVGGWRV
jgi:hypothetical protein